MGMFVNALDASIVNVALPDIQRDLHFTQSGLAWVVDAYLITFAGFLMLAGRLGDVVGRKKIFLAGIALFTLSSVMCAIAQSQSELIAGRFLQGVGGAFSASVIVAIIVTEFPDPTEQAKAMSAYIFVAVGGNSIGVLVGGIITQVLNWHWIFLINVPIGVATLVLGRILIDENEGLGFSEGVDIGGSVLVTLALMAAILAIIEATTYGWLSGHTAVIGGTAVLMTIGFVVLEGRLSHPMMPLRIFRIHSLVNSSTVRGFLIAGVFSTNFFGAIYLEEVLGYSPALTGLAYLPFSITLGIMSLGITSRLVVRFGRRRILLTGMILATAGLVTLSRIGDHPGFLTTVLPSFLLLGVGVGLAFVPLLAFGMADVPKEDVGLGSGVISASTQMSAALGLAIFSTLATSRAHAIESAGGSKAAGLVGAYRLVFLIAAACVGVGTVLAAVVMRESAPEADTSPLERRFEVENAIDPLAS
jgi:EmrB/QacA subfamily drug resistance transporter